MPMVSRSSQSSVWILAVLLVLAIGFAGYWFFRNGWLHVQVALAEEQTLYFEEARREGLEISEPREIVEYMRGILNYYPSGTKQTTGSHLDGMVERARRLALEDLIHHLRVETRLDLGKDPQKWIERLGGQNGQPDGPANRSKPIRAETNQTSVAAGSDR